MAARTGYTASRRTREQLHWGASGLFFIGLGFARFANLEEQARQSFREIAVSHGEYAVRWDVQVSIAVLVILLGTAAFYLLVHSYLRHKASRSAQFVSLARLGICGFIPLYILRILSLHATDRLLYSGPIRLNWVIDGGLTLIVVAAALLYWDRLGRSKKERRPTVRNR